MHNLYNLKTKLIKELEGFAEQGELTKTSLDAVDKIAHATKNLIKVIEDCEEYNYSNSRGMSYVDPHMSSYNRGSYAEGYSRSEEQLKNQIYSLMDGTTDTRTKEELRKLAERF